MRYCRMGARLVAPGAMGFAAGAAAHAVPERAALHGAEGGPLAVLADTVLHMAAAHAPVLLLAAGGVAVSAALVWMLRRTPLRRRLGASR